MSAQEGCLPRGVSTIKTPGHYPSMQWGCLPRGGVCLGEDVCPGGMYFREVSTTHTSPGIPPPPETAIEAGYTHLTRMHSCLKYFKVFRKKWNI